MRVLADALTEPPATIRPKLPASVPMASELISSRVLKPVTATPAKPPLNTLLAAVTVEPDVAPGARLTSNAMVSLLTVARSMVARLLLMVIPSWPGLPVTVAPLMFRVEPVRTVTLRVVASVMFSVLLFLTE
ncbi:hypothetical protein D3C85_731960 [compost metagenome]